MPDIRDGRRRTNPYWKEERQKNAYHQRAVDLLAKQKFLVNETESVDQSPHSK